MATQTASSKTALTGVKYLFWTFVGAGVGAIIGAIPGLHVPTAWKAVIDIAAATLGKMVATYIATRVQENAP